MTWPTKKLGELVDFLDNQRKPINDEDRQKRIGPYPYYGANGQVGWIDDFIFDEDLVLLAEDGGYFGSKDRPIAYRISGKTWVNNHAHVMRVKRSVAEIGFIHCRLMFYDIKPYITGSTRTKLNKSAAEKIKIPLPPLATQKQIVERLDKIAEAQKLNDGLIQKSDELFQSLLHQELKPAGKDWDVKKLEALVENVKLGPFGSALKIAELSDSGPVRVLFIENVVNNKFELAKEKYISEKKYKELEVYTVEPDDILITMMGTIGRTCITPKNLGRAIISSHLIKITPDKKIAIPEYLNFSLHSPYVTDQIRRKAKGAIMKGLNSKILRNLDVPLPPLETQKQIVAKLSAVQDYKKQLLAQRAKLKELFDSVLTKSMSGEYEKSKFTPLDTKLSNGAQRPQ